MRDRSLLVLDALLGWPEALGNSLAHHCYPMMNFRLTGAGRASRRVGLALALMWIVALPVNVYAQSAALACDRGPIEKVFGGTRWLVYSCSDSQSVVLVSAPGTPASPFYFTFSPENGDYHLRGEGAGNKAATDATLADLKKLVKADILSLLRDTLANPGGASK